MLLMILHIPVGAKSLSASIDIPYTYAAVAVLVLRFGDGSESGALVGTCQDIYPGAMTHSHLPILCPPDILWHFRELP